MSRLFIQLIAAGLKLFMQVGSNAWSVARAKGMHEAAKEVKGTATSVKGGASASASAAEAAAAAEKNANLMSLDEARKILGVTESNGLQQIDDRFLHLFRHNDPKNGGTLYLQSKIVRAKETLNQHFGIAQVIPGPGELKLDEDEKKNHSDDNIINKQDTKGDKNDDNNNNNKSS